MIIFTAFALYFLDAGVWWWVAYGVYVLSEAATAVYKRKMK